MCRLVGSTRHCRDIIDGIDNNNKIDFEGTVVCILVGKIVILVHEWQSVGTINKFVIAVPS